MKEKPTKQSRREFLYSLGEVGGSAAVYHAMLAMGLLAAGDAGAATTRKKWLERSQSAASGPKPTVAVLGGGISGLCVAYELKKAGFPFFVVESRTRPDGRNHTIRAGTN